MGCCDPRRQNSSGLIGGGMACGGDGHRAKQLTSAKSPMHGPCACGKFHSISLLFGLGLFTPNHDRQNAQRKAHVHGCDGLTQ